MTTEAAILRWLPEGSPYIELPGRLVLELLVAKGWDRVVIDVECADAFPIVRTDAARLVAP